MSLKTVLLVEDEEELRELLAAELRNSSLVVFEASNGRQAAEKFRESPVDLIITDLRMPGGDGLELLKSVQDHRGHTRTILMSGFADCTASFAKSLGADELLHKPFSLVQFIETVEKLLKS